MDRHMLRKMSKFLSQVLRHNPEKIGLFLDGKGWAEVNELVTKSVLSRDQVEEIVKNDSKQRYALSECGERIRANQGHSIQVDLGLTADIPPGVLYHGTAETSIESIFRSGLHSGRRTHVHLSRDVETALNVGRRHGRAVVLQVDSLRMHEDGAELYISKNGVWLTNWVDAKYLSVLDAASSSAIGTGSDAGNTAAK